jgi:hypothetical protein
VVRISGESAEYLAERFIPQGLILEGKVLPMHKLGSDFYRYLT